MKNRLSDLPVAARVKNAAIILLLIFATAHGYAETTDVPPLPGTPVARTFILDSGLSSFLPEGDDGHHSGPIIHSIEITEHRLVKQYLDKYRSEDGVRWIEACLRRGAPYINYISERIAYHDVPPELIHLPIIESAFYPNAVSRSGAVGLWQFMMNSIGPFGMVVDEWQDDRRDFWKSTDAAIRKLKENYEYLGDWLLAIGAYNCGLGCMSRAVKRAGSDDFWTLADGGYLPDQTVHYVPKFLAVAHVASYGGRYGVETRWDPPIRWERIPVSKPVSLSMLAEASGVPLTAITTGNPELKQGITPPTDAPYYLKVDSKFTDSIVEALANEDIQLLSFRVHPIRTGDTLFALSQRYDVPVTLIIRHNPGIKADALRIGEKIIVPVLGEDQQHHIAQTAVGDLPELDYVYTVQKGDTLWAIARAFGTIPEVLATGNNMNVNGVLTVGTSLRVPQPPVEEQP